METTIKKKTTKKTNFKTDSFETFERKINLPNETITDEEILKEVKEVRYARKK